MRREEEEEEQQQVEVVLLLRKSCNHAWRCSDQYVELVNNLPSQKIFQIPISPGHPLHVNEKLRKIQKTAKKQRKKCRKQARENVAALENVAAREVDWETQVDIGCLSGCFES